MEKTVKIPLQISVRDLASRLDISSVEVLKKLMENGIIANINEAIDYDTAVIISQELGFITEPDKELGDEEVITFEKLGEIITIENQNKEILSERPPVITILGHVDHGKTTLLDTLRKTHVADKEHGGITQHITAYQVRKKGKLVTFIDTPGHEAFQSMRERGASIADIAVLVVAADDGVKPQTKEVIDFLVKQKIPTVVAINKIDKPEANINKVKQELAEAGILVEGYGGEIPFNEISAKNNIGLDDLLDTILLVSEVHDFRADKKRDALGIVLEAHKDPKKGPVATVLVKTGTLKIGQDILIGNVTGRVRKIEDYAGKSLETAGPSTPVTIIGLGGVPQSQDILQVEKDIQHRRQKAKMLGVMADSSLIKTAGSMSSQQLISSIDMANVTKLPIIIKADVQGTLEAIHQIIGTIKSDEVKPLIVSDSVGAITESDVKVAQTSGATIYGFSTNATSVASRLAENTGVTIKTYKIIYELIEDIKGAMSELLPPEIKRTDLGKLKVLAIFKSSKNEMIVGGKVVSGKIVKGEKLELLREKVAIAQGELTQLQHNKEDVSEVKEGLECGMTFRGKAKIQVGDILISFKEETIKRKI